MALIQKHPKQCGVMIDLKGPSIYSGDFQGVPTIEVFEGQTMMIHTNEEIVPDNEQMSCSYAALTKAVSVGS